MAPRIQPFNADDYPQLVTVLNAVYPEYPVSVAEVLHEDETLDPRCVSLRLLARDGDRAVGYAHVTQQPTSYHPRRFQVDIGVVPDARGRGIGRELYNVMRELIAPRDPLALRTQVREDMDAGLAFAARRGYAEVMRAWESRLNLTTFDPARFADAVDRLGTQGLRTATLAELGLDEPSLRRVHALIREVHKDVPSPETPTAVDFETWRRQRLENPNHLPEAHVFALDGDTLVGYSGLWPRHADRALYTGLTGVRRSHRRRGIAFGLKVLALAWAKERGYATVHTWNESNNVGMLGINVALGFVRQPAWLDLVHTIAED